MSNFIFRLLFICQNRKKRYVDGANSAENNRRIFDSGSGAMGKRWGSAEYLSAVMVLNGRQNQKLFCGEESMNFSFSKNYFIILL